MKFFYSVLISIAFFTAYWYVENVEGTLLGQPGFSQSVKGITALLILPFMLIALIYDKIHKKK